MKFDFLRLAFKTAIEVADMSKYDGSHVGAVIVRNSRIVATGWNGYPRGLDDRYINTLPRDKRLMMTIHAENNALLNAAKDGVQLEGSEAIVTHKPCVQCLSKMRNAGIERVCYIHNPGFEAAWCDDHNDLYEMISPSRVALDKFDIDHVLDTSHHKNLYRTLDKYQIDEKKTSGMEIFLESNDFTSKRFMEKI